jgi:hypothetical protein
MLPAGMKELTADYFAFVQRAASQRREHKGGKRPSKITPQITMMVHMLKEAGRSVAYIAAEVGLSQTTVREIIRGY